MEKRRRNFHVSALKRKIMLTLMEHPKVAFSQILKALKWIDGNIYEDHQNTHVYIIPAGIFQQIRIELKNTVGKKVARSLLYHLNQSSADSIIKDAIEQDFKGKDLFRYFLGIMGLFGWGFSEQWDFDPEIGSGTITISNFPKSNSIQPEPVHDDFAGIIARALQMSYGGNYEVTEINCCEMAEDAVDCSYEIKPLGEQSRAMGSKAEMQNVDELDAKQIANPEEFDNIISRFSMPENGILMLGHDGTPKRVVIKDVPSINSMFLKTADLLGWKTVGPVCFRVGRNHVINELAGNDKIDLDFIQDYFRQLSYFGWGLFDVQPIDEKYHVIVRNHAFSAGFPVQQTATDYLVGGIINGLFERLKGKRVAVKELACQAKGEGQCLFEVT